MYGCQTSATAYTLTPAGDIQERLASMPSERTPLSTRKEAKWAPEPVPWCSGQKNSVFLWHNLEVSHSRCAQINIYIFIPHAVKHNTNFQGN